MRPVWEYTVATSDKSNIMPFCLCVCLCVCRFDKDGSGNIDAGELKQALVSFGYQL